MTMNNKVLIKLYIPEIDEKFDVFIPVNEVIWKIKKMLAKSVSSLTGSTFNANDKYVLMNKITSKIYGNNEIIINTDIRNASELILIISNVK